MNMQTFLLSQKSYFAAAPIEYEANSRHGDDGNENVPEF
jgi:hypothetical protein